MFSPIPDLYRLKTLIKAFSKYLDATDPGFESRRRLSEITSVGEHDLDIMLLKYSTSGLLLTRAEFLMEAEPALTSLQSAFLVLKGDHNGGSYSDNCWSDCVEDCKPTDIGGIVCHLSCYYTCETGKP